MLKSDPVLLKDDQYSELSNMVSVQEGNLAIRNGNRRVSNGVGPVIDTITKLRITERPQLDTYYVCENGNIWSAPGPIPGPGSVFNFTKIASGVSSGASYTDKRISSANYNAGSVGQSWKYFAGSEAMVKDNGTLSTAPDWGILPPEQPVFANLDSSLLEPTYDLVALHGSPTRISSAIASVSAGTGPGLITINPTSMTGIYAGMVMQVGSQVGYVTAVQDFTFQIYLNNTPTVGDPLTSGIITATAPGTLPVLNVPIDGSFGGDVADGYVTEDPVHVSISLSDPTQFTDIRLRVLLNGSSTDYYEKSILPNALQDQVSTNQNATANLQSAATQISQNILGAYDISDPQVNTAKAQQLTPTAAGTSLNAVWTEIDTAKSQFLSVGNAGAGLFTWKTITGFQVFFAVVPGTTPSISISSIYLAGGASPNAFSISSTTPLTPYHYVYTFRDPQTGAESNPSQPMIQDNWVTPNKQRVAVRCWSSLQPQVFGPNSIAVYRAGGSFSDDFYRFVGYAQNPTIGTFVYFYDNQADSTIAANDIAEFDNDPPVTSSLKTPCTLSFIAYTGGVNGLAGGISLFRVAVVTGPTNNIADFLRVGSTIHIAQNTAVSEEAYIYSINLTHANEIGVYFQYDHTNFANNGTVIGEVDAVAGMPCNLALSAFDSIFLAGDANNPQVLYKSKTGRPEAFPVIDIATGTANQINVGSPSNPIMAILEFSGTILCLNYQSIFVVGVAQGVMGTPAETPAQRGLISRNAWCIADNEIWYLGYDGLYSWSGGQAVWRTEALDPLFRNQTMGSYLPVDMRPALGNIGLDIIEMAYNDNEVLMIYQDISGVFRRMRYHTKFDRWSIDTIYDASTGTTPSIVSAVFEDMDLGEILLAKIISSNGFLYLDNAGTSDGWFNSPSDGQAIPWAVTPAVLTEGSTSIDVLFSDMVLEVDNDGSAVSIQSFYDFSTTPDATDNFTIPAPGAPVGRVRYPFSFHEFTGGFQAHALQQRFSGSSAVGLVLYSLITNLVPLAQYSSGRAFDYDSLGYPCDKLFRALDIEIDTGGVQGTIQPYGDGSPLGPALTLTTTATDRRRILSMASGPGTSEQDLICKNIKPVLMPGPGGKMDYFNHNWDFIKEPCAQTHWDSFEFTFDYDGYSFLKQFWIEYQCLSPITLLLYVDDGILFYATQLPAHIKRDVYRFYLPAFTEYTILVLNKAKRHRFTLDTTNLANPFKMYKDSSRIEWLACGSDQRAAYQQAPLSTLMGPSI